MKKIFVIICCLACSLSISAQSLREIWIEMPDSIVPYLTKSQRTELVDYIKMNVTPVVKNTFGDSTFIKKMTKDYLKVSLNKNTQLEIKILDPSSFALVETWNGPVAESKLRIYDYQWKARNITLPETFSVQRPDTMSNSAYADLCSIMTPRLQELHFSDMDNFLLVDYNFPLLSKEDVKRARMLLKPSRLIWTGKVFRYEK